MAYRNIKITKGADGFGGPLIIEPTETRNKVLCVTGQTISPVAKKIAEMTGCELVDGFSTTVPDEQVAVAVVNCGGTARCGVYPRKKILTVNVEPVGAVGPLAQYITPDLYVSDVKESNLSYTDESAASAATV
jgi:PTS system glucitol/sorbitol-specific IIB component